MADYFEIEVYRNGEGIAPTISTSTTEFNFAQYSKNVPVKATYTGSSTVGMISFWGKYTDVDGVEHDEELKYTGELYLIPARFFQDVGMISLCVHVTSSGTVLVSNELDFVVKKASGEYSLNYIDWESQVLSVVNESLDSVKNSFQAQVDKNTQAFDTKIEELIADNESNIKEVKEKMEEVIDSEETAFEEFKAEYEAKFAELENKILNDVASVVNDYCPFKVGEVIMTVTNTNPSTKWKNSTTWIRVFQGRTIVGAGTGTDANGLEKTFAVGDEDGEYAHTLTVDELPTTQFKIPHVWGINELYVDGGGYTETRPGDTQYETEQHSSELSSGTHLMTMGGGESHNILQPYGVVYFWKRTA